MPLNVTVAFGSANAGATARRLAPAGKRLAEANKMVRASFGSCGVLEVAVDLRVECGT